MPLPIPADDESRDDFLSRCAGDETVNADFPDADQRVAVCGKLYDKREDMRRAMFSIVQGIAPPDRLVAHFRAGTGKSYEWDAEVFAVGTWNGYRFSEQDLTKIVESFKALNGGGHLEVPLKFGHNDSQPITDGHPALGWVQDLYIKKDDKGRSKLMAKLSDVPEVVYTAATKGLYRKVSIELEFDVKHKGTMYPYVMTGIALLGADLPAVNTLADLNAYMGRDPLVAAKRAAFSAVTGNPPEEGKKMAEIDDKELQELREQAAKAADTEAKLAQFTADQQAEKTTTARNAVNARLDQAVKDMQITPAQRASFAKVLRVDDDEAVRGLAVADVEALLPEKPAEDDKGRRTYGRQSAQATDGSTDDILDQATRKIIAESGGKMSYSRALEMAMSADPETAKAHRGLGA